MNLKACSILYFLSPRKTNTSYLPIYTRIIYNRQKAEFAIGEHIYIYDWNKEKGEARNDIRLNEHLIYIRNQIIETKRNLERKNKNITAKKIKSEFLEKGKENQMPVYRFVKDALIRRYGQDFYDELEAAAQFVNNESKLD